MEPQARIKRLHEPSKIRRSSKYFRKDALPPLLGDFGRRCAYCLSHADYVGGDEAFDIDHFHPSAKGGSFTDYRNLYLACRQCNKHKWDFWPGKLEREHGVRFLDCTKELDYGYYVFETADGYVVPKATSKAAIYHCRILKLNRADLLRSRRKRTALLAHLKDKDRLSRINFTVEQVDQLTKDIDELMQLINHLIPEIPAPDISDNSTSDSLA
jgi:hypothetical protein